MLDNMQFSMVPAEAAWYAAWVMPRHEKAVSRLLKQLGYVEFLPLYEARRRWSDRVKKVRLPLFSGYVFCQLDAPNPAKIVSLPGILAVVKNGNRWAAIDAAELAAIQRVVNGNIAVEPCPFVTKGDRVRIESGPLAGLSGILQEIHGRRQLVLSISEIGRSVAVAVHDQDVRLLDAALAAQRLAIDGPALPAASGGFPELAR
jgi:transcription antitermination factor NusG